MKQAAWLAFSINRRDKTPVFEQICDFFRRAAISGTLVEGQKLPSTREFALQLGVSRPTVVSAYEQLVAEGYLQNRLGSGFYLCGLGDVELPAAPIKRVIDGADETPEQEYPFLPGRPDMRLFPHRQWAKTVARICRTQPETMLVGGTAFGNSDLREAISAHVSEWRGIEAQPGQIVVTAGSTDALELCLRCLTSPGDQIGLERPGYPTASHLVASFGLGTEHLSIDDDGTVVPAAEANPKIIVLTPSHQYPLGGAMSARRRMEFIHWAQQSGGWIVEDDFDSEFRYAGRPIPALAGFDGLERTIYIGSFTKLFSSSLRLGYLVLPETLIEHFKVALARYRSKASYMPQQALATYMKTGDYYRHLRRVRRVYGKRRDFLLDRLRAEFSSFGSFRDHQAGMQVVFHLNPPYEDTVIAARAVKRGIAAPALSSFCSPPSGYNGLVLGFSAFTEEEMSAALEVLRNCFEADP